MLRDIARAVVLKYPEPWLDRYGDEVLELVDDSPVRISDLAELSRGLIVERMKALLEPGDAPRVAFVVLGTAALLVRIAPSGLLLAGAAALGQGARRVAGPPPPYVFETGVLLFTSLVIVHFWRKWTTRASHRWAVRNYRRYPARVRVLMISATVVCTFILFWVPGSAPNGNEALHTLNRVCQLFIWITFVDSLTSGFWPWRPMFDAMDAYSQAARELRWAQMEVDRCSTLVDAGDGDSEGLANAEIARDRLIRQRDDAAAVLHSYGYRAKFRGVA
jgi:hypothetical protein